MWLKDIVILKVSQIFIIQTIINSDFIEEISLKMIEYCHFVK